MNTQQLRNSILQQAIQGKLVPQDPNDEPASVLLDRIRKEKEQLVKEGKLKKKDLVTTPVTEDEMPFDIPQSWKWVRLGEIVDIYLGFTYKPKYDENGVMFLSVKDISSGKIKLDNTKYVSQEVYENAPKGAKPQKGDILFGRVGTLGKPSIVDFDTPFCIFVSLGYLRCFSESVDKKYICHWMYSAQFFDEIRKRVKGTAQVNLNTTWLREFPLPLPPLAEQKRIVAKLEELLPLVEQYGKAQDDLDALNNDLPRRLRQSILQEAIQGKLVPQEESDGVADFLSDLKEAKTNAFAASLIKKTDSKVLGIAEEEVPFEIPDTWQWYRLSDIANMYTGDSINAEEKLAKYTNVKGRFYIGTKDVGFDHAITYDNGVAIPTQYEPNFKIAKAGSILLCVEGGSAGRKIGRLNQDVCFGNKLCCFTPYILVNDFLYYYLQSNLFTDVFRSNVSGIIGGVSVNTLKALPIPLPPLAEQHRIVAKIEQLFTEIDKLVK